MLGGVARQGHPTTDAAFWFFLRNSTRKILSNNTISCITFVAELNDGIDSPFMHVRRGMFGNPVRRMLLKFFPLRPKINPPPYDPYPNFLDIPGRAATPSRNYRGIELADFADVRKEFNLQMEIYRRSFLTHDNVLDPLCPCPIFLTYVRKDAFLERIHTEDDFLKLRSGKTRAQEIAEITTIFGNTEFDNMALIGMEFMEGYDTYEKNVVRAPLSQARKDLFSSLARYELDRLHALGVSHGDFHEENVMVNLTSGYITFSNPVFLGRALIIDFGRSQKHSTIPPAIRIDAARSAWARYVDPSFSRDVIVQRLDTVSRDAINSMFDKFMNSKVVRILPEAATGGGDLSKEKEDDTFTLKEIFNNKTVDEVYEMIISHLKFLDELELEINKSDIKMYSDVITPSKGLTAKSLKVPLKVFKRLKVLPSKKNRIGNTRNTNSMSRKRSNRTTSLRTETEILGQ